MELKDGLEKLDLLRRDRETAHLVVSDALVGAEEAVRKEYKLTFDTLSRLDVEIPELEQQIRQKALEEYQLTKQKTLYGGVGIRVRTKLIYDKDRALEWALDHKMAMSLDMRKFEEIAKTKPQGVDFVKFEEEVIATIPKDIGKIE
jgi:peroxiredoxin